MEKEAAIDEAMNFLREGDSPEKVSRCIGLPLEEVLDLQKNLTVNAYKNNPATIASNLCNEA